MLKVSRVAHAGIVVETPNVRCLMDPILKTKFMGGCLELWPKAKFRYKNLKTQGFDLLIISHEHEDHFDLPSLDLIDRAAKVVYPKGSPWVESCLKRMGFKDFHPLAPYEKLKYRDLSIMATPSEVPFPEMGVIFKYKKTCVWNLVDSVITRANVKQTISRFGKPSLVLSPFQPVIEIEIGQDALGAPFPIADYRHILNVIKWIQPTYLIPSAFGYKNRINNWLNQRQFPMVERQFSKDVEKMSRSTRVISMRPGDGLQYTMGKWAFQSQCLKFVQASRPQRNYELNWRPDEGIPPVVSSARLSKAQFKRIDLFINSHFLSFLNKSVFKTYVRPLRRLECLWRLEITASPTVRHARVIDFSEKKLSFRKPQLGDYYKLQTQIAADTLLRALDGTLSPYGVVLGMGALRSVNRLYQINENGLKDPKLKFYQDPLSAVLGMNFLEKYFIRELNRLGY